jgi:hypothetical protein
MISAPDILAKLEVVDDHILALYQDARYFSFFQFSLLLLALIFCTLCVIKQRNFLLLNELTFNRKI